MSEPVKRYNLRQNIPATATAFLPDVVVSAADYARLEQECERLRGLLLDAKAALDPFDDKLLEARIDAALAEINP